jgi:hypothetical protein
MGAPSGFAALPPSLADLLIRTGKAKNANGLIDVEPKVGLCGTVRPSLSTPFKPF